jgi:SAM-dependent methyltransferase
MDPTDPMEQVMRARAARSPADAVAVYRDWAADYDRDVFGRLGFTGTQRIAELLAAYLHDPETPVIDLGCGTGAVAANLRGLGITTVDGVDISPEMLAVARDKGLYRTLTLVDLTGPIPVPDATYGASVSAGTFTTGHVGPESVPEALRVLRPGAVVAWAVAASLSTAVEAAIVERGFVIVHRSVEPVRRDGPSESVMIVARVRELSPPRADGSRR